MDTVNSLRTSMRAHLLNELGNDPSGELGNMSLEELLLIYGNWRRRFVSERPRKVHQSNEMLANPKSGQHRVALSAIIDSIKAGGDITPHLSRRVMVPYEPTAQRSAKLQGRHDLDLLIADWGIHHLHLSTSVDADGFVTRTGDLLFAVFTQDDAYLVDILPHNSWTDLNLLHVVARNSPKAGIIREIEGLSLQAQFSDGERRRLRNAGTVSAIEIDGKIFVPAGQTTAGTSIRNTIFVHQVIHSLNWLDEISKNKPEWLEDALRDRGIAVTPQDNWQPLVRGSEFGFVEQERQIFYPIGSLIV